MNLEDRKKEFLKIYKLADKKYGKSKKRLAGEGWKHPWQTLIVTIFSAQTRDEVNIPVSEKLFKKYDTLEKLAKADPKVIEMYIRPLNFYLNKSKNSVATAKILLEKYDGRVPDTIEELVELPGVGRKTANLIIAEIYNKDGVCVDTHVHRISNVFGLVDTKTPEKTEQELMKIAPKKLWSKINRVFVLWGQDVRGRDKEKFLEKVND